MKQTLLCLLIAIIVCLPCAYGATKKAYGQKKTGKTASPFENEAQVLDKVDLLLSDGKTDEALTELDKGLQQYPSSMNLIRKKYDILWSAKRFEKCLQLLNDIYPKVPAEVHQDILSGKRFVLFELIKVALENMDNQTALQRLEELAEAGYRGFHDLNHDEIFKPLWNLPKYKYIQNKIAENAGIGRPARDFTAELTNGESFTLSEQKDKVVLVDFWSTFCVPCKKELPNLKYLYSVFKDKGFEIISISLDTKKRVLDSYLAEYPMPWKTVFSGNGFDDDIARLYEVTWVPSYWLVDKKGILRYHDVRGEDLKSTVTHLVNEK